MPMVLLGIGTGLTAILALAPLAATPRSVELFVIDGGVTPPLRQIAPRAVARGVTTVRPASLPPILSGGSLAPELLFHFPGLGAGEHGFVPSMLPPDANGAVGATQHVQGVNEAFAVFDKATGALVFGRASTDVLWTRLGGCLENAQRAPQFYYDGAAQRWIVLQGAFRGGPTPTALQCLAISRTPDASGPYRTFAIGLG